MTDSVECTAIIPSTDATDASDCLNERLLQAQSILSLMMCDDAITYMSKEVQSNSIWAVSSLIDDALRFQKHQMKQRRQS
jgi:hypothetical protein